MLDGIMRLAAFNANKQFQTLSDISINIANMNTNGYKRKEFEQYLNNDNMLNGVTRIDVGQGDHAITRRELDVAVSGTGYIPVTQPDGTVAYTRDGSLAMNSQGYLVTARGDMVADGIQVPVDHKTITIKETGDVTVTTSKEMQPKIIGKISLVRFVNPEKLQSIGDNKLKATEESGGPQSDPDSQLKQGMVERANVNVYEQIEQVLRLNAAAISNMRIIKFTDDLLRQSANLKQ
jgi:flagellar basal-body rod protein FlgG